MKKTRFLIALILLLAASPNVWAGTGLQYGIKAGVSFGDQTWNYSNELGQVNRDQRKGYAFGVFADWSLTPLLGLRPEVLYVQKGSQIQARTGSYPYLTGGTITFRDRVNYLSLLATAKLQFGGGPIGFYLIGGPRVDLKLNSNSTLASSDMQAILDSYKSTVPGLTFGVGAQSSLSPFGPIMLEFRYDYDSREAAKYVGNQANIVIDNKTYTILFGLLF